jgi:hypothetical protein
MSDFQVTRHNLQNGETGLESLPTALHSENAVSPVPCPSAQLLYRTASQHPPRHRMTAIVLKNRVQGTHEMSHDIFLSTIESIHRTEKPS